MIIRARSYLSTALGEFAALEVDARVLVATIVLSTILGLGALALGQRMVVVAFALLVPWVPILIAKVRSDWLTYGWLAFFEFVVILQIAHFAEHVSQMVELHFLAWAPYLARGIISELDTEQVHFWWNTTILIFATLLLFRYRSNRWLLASWLFSIWHEVEHVYIYFWWYLPQGVSNHPGILGAGGLVDEAGITIPVLTTLGRADLHFWYNFFEIGLFVVAFIWQTNRVLQPQDDSVLAIRPRRRNAFAFIAAGQIALVTLVGLLHFSPATLNVPQNYATIQQAVDAAPDFAIIRVAPGTYSQALRINKPLILQGAGRASTVISSPSDAAPVISIGKTHDVTIDGFTLDGGLYGVLIETSRRVQITNNSIVHTAWVGVRVSSSQASIVSNDIHGTRSQFGMGVELANTINSAATLVRSNMIADNPHGGIVLHNSNAMIERNRVENNGLRGIAITEMSMAMVNANDIRDNGDSGISIVDYSMAELQNNSVRGTRPGPLGLASGIMAEYNSELMLRSNTVVADQGRDVVLQSGSYIQPW